MSELPNEVIVYLFTYLNNWDITRFRLICKKYNTIFENHIKYILTQRPFTYFEYRKPGYISSITYNYGEYIEYTQHYDGIMFKYYFSKYIMYKVESFYFSYWCKSIEFNKTEDEYVEAITMNKNSKYSKIFINTVNDYIKEIAIFYDKTNFIKLKCDINRLEHNKIACVDEYDSRYNWINNCYRMGHVDIINVNDRYEGDNSPLLIIEFTNFYDTTYAKLGVKYNKIVRVIEPE